MLNGLYGDIDNNDSSNVGLNSLDDILMVEKYRPRKIEDCILPSRIKDVLQQMVDSKNIRSYTAVGSPGSGKTSSARALVEELGAEYIIINASEDGNIDTVRNKVREFATKRTASKLKYKVIIMDEVDGATSSSYFNALRGVIEEFQTGCKFIFTANYANKIPPAITSRCPVINFEFSKEERVEMVGKFFKRITQILKERNVEYDQKDLLQFCNTNFPDFRRTLNNIDRLIINNVLDLNNASATSFEKISEIITYLKNGEFSKMEKWVIETGGDTDGASIRRSLFENRRKYLQLEFIPDLIFILNEYDERESRVADKEINMIAMFTKIMTDLQFL